MFDQPVSIQFSLPDWIAQFTETVSAFPDIEDRMGFVIEASRKNIEQETGGPFAAAILRSSAKFNLKKPRRFYQIIGIAVAPFIIPKRPDAKKLRGIMP